MEIIKNIKIGNNDFVLRTVNLIDGENFTVYIEAFAVSGELYQEKDVVYDPPKPFYQNKNRAYSNNTTHDLNEAERVLHCYIKWDGCSDIDFYPDRDGTGHFCGKSGVLNLGALLDQVYEYGAELLGSTVHEGYFYD